MSQITPTIVISSFEETHNRLFFHAWHITHILNCATELSSAEYPVNLPTYKILLDDDEDFAPAEALIRLAAGKLEEWTKGGGTVLVHCQAGISRSPTVVMAWFILYKGYSFDDAWTTVVKAHPQSRPNRYFVKILKALATPFDSPQ